jgi:hypothetical protein
MTEQGERERRLLRAVSAFPDQCMGIYRVGTMGVLKR